ncbi:hypothetical protein [Microseira sp. BLCC-F43]|jgi:hypothetical protein|uniref:hypothetical protein n=1 Tax=Microseira sp. BLCC-F43 TaxID=3153602 RepID=UPI0035B8B009
MTAFNPPVSVCRYCQHYKPMGRRGGACEMLNVSVQAVWKGCQLGVPTFTTAYESYAKCDLVRQN